MLSAIERNPPTCVLKFARKVEAIETYRGLYRDITSNGTILQYNDRYALGELAVMMVEVQLLRDQLYGGEDGEFMEVQGDRNKIMKKNPARDALEKIRSPMLKLMKEFKMTPSSRKTIIGVSPGAGEDDNEFDNF